MTPAASPSAAGAGTSRRRAAPATARPTITASLSVSQMARQARWMAVVTARSLLLLGRVSST